jgi:hypothetical protein
MEDLILQWAISAGMILAGIVAGLILAWALCLAYQALDERLS